MRRIIMVAIMVALFLITACGAPVVDQKTDIPVSEETFMETDISTNLEEGLDEPASRNVEKLLELFVEGEIPAHAMDEEGNVRKTFTINDLDMSGEDYFSYSVGERADLDNDGERELVLDGAYGGMYLDAREGQIYVLAEGRGTAETLGYTEFDGETWIVYSDVTHQGRKTYDLYCYDGEGNITDEFRLAKWFWSVAEDEPGMEYEYRGEKIDKEQYDSLYQKMIAPMYTRQKCFYAGEVWGEIEAVHREFPEDAGKKDGKVSYYYEMEKFYVKADLPKADVLNDTLQHIYDGLELVYLENAEWYASAGSGEEWQEDTASDMSEAAPNDIPETAPNDMPEAAPNDMSKAAPEDMQGDLQQDSSEYAKWYLVQLAYAGEDYISLWYNDIAYMGGAHPYSYFDGITVSCRTGLEITAADILGTEEGEILRKVSEEMGLADTATWDDIDFYLTDSEIVFFYRMPGYWDDVVWERKQ